MLWLPTGSADVVDCAWPVPSKVPLPNGVPPSLKTTVPVGVPPSWLVTVAVKVAGEPYVVVLADDETVVIGGVMEKAAAGPTLAAPSLAVTVYWVGVRVLALVSVNDVAIVAPSTVPLRATV